MHWTDRQTITYQNLDMFLSFYYGVHDLYDEGDGGCVTTLYIYRRMLCWGRLSILLWYSTFGLDVVGDGGGETFRTNARIDGK